MNGIPHLGPYLSVVATARNDDHGGNLLGRMQAFVNNWIQQAGKHGIHAELILVEWNPPSERPRLAEALQWPENRCCEVRIIEVPGTLHRRFAHADTLPLYQMIAKNAGIRRAKGRFVLATNIDILLSDELAAFLASEQLQPGRMYRIDRYDAMNGVPAAASPEEQIAYCRSHLIRVNTRYGTFSVTPDGRPVLQAEDIAGQDSGLIFGRGWFPPEKDVGGETFRWAAQEAEVTIAGRGGVLVFEMEPGPGSGGLPLDMEIAANSEILGRFAMERPTRVAVSHRNLGRLDFHVYQGGAPLRTDGRVLNFRAARFRWNARAHPGAPRLRVRRIGTGWKWWKISQHIIRRLANEGPLHLTVPVSPRLRRILRYYVQAGGIMGMGRRTIRSLAGGLLREVAADTDAIHPALVEAPETPAPAFLHTNACGDFTLLAREHWLDLRGYPEFDLFSMNLDSVFCFAAHYGGAQEEVLPEPLRIYHIEHCTGSGWTPDGQTQLFRRLKATGLSFVDNADVLGWASQMKKLGTPMIFNHENWGLADYELEEKIIGAERRNEGRLVKSLSSADENCVES